MIGRAARIAGTCTRHPHLILVAAAGGGFLLAPAGGGTALVPAALLAAAGAILIARRRPDADRIGAVLVAAAALLAAGGFAGAARVRAIDAPAERIRPGQRIDARAYLIERPRRERFGTRAEVEITDGPASGARLLARTSGDARWPALAPGGELLVRGVVRKARSPPGGFDMEALLRRRGVAAELRLETVEPTGRRRGGLAGVLDAARVRAERALSAGLPRERAALARGIVLGQDEAIPRLVRDDFRASGLAHILAVSGQNVMLLAALAFPLLALAGAGPRARSAGVIALIALYVPLAGAGPSLQRAGVMGAAAIVALAAGRPASRWYALGLAALVTLAVNPRAAAEPGWQLSFAAVAGILLLAPSLRPRGLPRLLAEGLAITVAATLATAPLLAHHFGAVSIASLPANVLALPAVAPVMWIGMVQCALGQLAPGVPALSVALGSLTGPLLGWLELVASRLAEPSWAQVDLELRTPWAVGAAYLLLGAAVSAAGWLARANAARAGSAASRLRLLPRGRRVALGAAAAALGVAAVAAAGGRAERPERPTVHFFDVGQGDATLVRHPDGSAVLFDGGPEDARVARLIRDSGVRRLSLVVATHASADHHGGLAEVLRRIPTDMLVDGGDGSPDAAFRAVLDEARRRGTPTVPARAGQMLHAGAIAVRILSPEPRGPGPAPEDPNPRAVVAVVSAGDFDLFLSADAESGALAPLPLTDVEAMKVPHHGSADPGLPAVLERLRPEVAVIEVGENSYGHPTASTLAALRDAVPEVRRTDRDGTVTLEAGASGLLVRTERRGG